VLGLLRNPAAHDRIASVDAAGVRPRTTHGDVVADTVDGADRVATGSTPMDVLSSAPEQQIVAWSAPETIVPDATRKQRVVTLATPQEVPSRPAEQLIPAARADQSVGSGVAVEEGIAPLATENVGVRRSTYLVSAVCSSVCTSRRARSRQRQDR
jgi:hypothetical protein